MFKINRLLIRVFSLKKLPISCNRKIHSRKRIFSGIQPTGAPHIGNYFGAIKKWTSVQNEGNDCIFCIADMHSTTIPRDKDPKKLRQNAHLMAACLLACGINPDKSTFFLQSEVLQHGELARILGCLTTKTRLMHLPQYKEKSAHLENVSLGLFTYPVLQCADILLYKATDVPVGEDQVQHIQLCQYFARKFNNKYGRIFPVPQASTDVLCARIKSLQDPEKKMSKSDTNFKNRIDLTDKPDIILTRIQEAVTDSTSAVTDSTPAVTYDLENRPSVSNIILIHSLCTGKSFEDICLESRHLNIDSYKLVVAEALIKYLAPIQSQIKHYMDNPQYLSEILEHGSEKAMDIAYKTMSDVKEAMGHTHNDICRGEVKFKM